MLFFSAAYLSLTMAVSPPYYVSRSFVLCYRKQTARTSEREEYAACRISLSIQCVKIMCGQVLKAVITMCIEINCDCVFRMITGRRLLKRVSNTPLFRFSLPRCVRISSHNGLALIYLLTFRRAHIITAARVDSSRTGLSPSRPPFFPPINGTAAYFCSKKTENGPAPFVLGVSNKRTLEPRIFKFF